MFIQKKLSYSGKFELPSVNVLELEIHDKDRIIKIPGGTYRDPNTGKSVIRTGLKVVSEDLGKAFEFRTLSIGEIRSVNIEANLTKFIITIDGMMYWRISNDMASCQ